MSMSCPCVGGSCTERAGNLVLFSVVRPLGLEPRTFVLDESNYCVGECRTSRAESVPKTVPLISTVTTRPGRYL
jgi:hypothetical protein